LRGHKSELVVDVEEMMGGRTLSRDHYNEQ